MAEFQFYFDAFGELSSSRSLGMTVGPIPFTAIVDYFRLYELEDFDEFLYLIRRIDRLFLELNAKANEPNKGDTGASTNTNKKNPNKS